MDVYETFDFLRAVLPILIGILLLVSFGASCWRQKKGKAIMTGITAFLALVIGIGRFAI